MHDVITVGLPLIAILAGILFSRSDIKELRTEVRSDLRDIRAEIKDIRAEVKDVRAEVKDLRREMNDHFGRIDADLRQFYHLTGTLEGRMDAIEKR